MRLKTLQKTGRNAHYVICVLLICIAWFVPIGNVDGRPVLIPIAQSIVLTAAAAFCMRFRKNPLFLLIAACLVCAVSNWLKARFSSNGISDGIDLLEIIALYFAVASLARLLQTMARWHGKRKGEKGKQTSARRRIPNYINGYGLLKDIYAPDHAPHAEDFLNGTKETPGDRFYKP